MGGDERTSGEHEVDAEPSLVLALDETAHLWDDVRGRSVSQGGGLSIATAERLTALVQPLEQLDGVVQVLVGVSSLELLARRHLHRADGDRRRH